MLPKRNDTDRLKVKSRKMVNYANSNQKKADAAIMPTLSDWEKKGHL